jgi:hypothetical protein
MEAVMITLAIGATVMMSLFAQAFVSLREAAASRDDGMLS